MYKSFVTIMQVILKIMHWNKKNKQQNINNNNNVIITKIWDKAKCESARHQKSD